MKSFFYKLIVFITVVMAAQIIIARYVFPEPRVALLDKYLKDKYQILFFGDSSVLYTANDEKNKSSIVEMVAEINPDYKIGNLGYPAHHLGVFEADMDYISRSSLKPEAVIFPIQLRSFSPEWDMRPVNQFEKEIFLLTDHTSFFSYFYTPLAIFRAINTNTVSYTEFLETPIYREQTRVGIVREFEAVNKNKPATEENIKNDYIYKYVFSIDKNHRKIKSLENLLNLANRMGVRVYAYISPIDYRTGEKYIGRDFIAQTKSNAELVCSVLKEKNTPCLNLAFDLTPDYFDHPAYPNEHLTAEGKKFVAGKISGFFFKKQPGE